MTYFKNEGHTVISLSQREGVEFNPYLNANGIEAYSYVVPGEASLFFFLRHILYFIKFCKTRKIDFVFSHLDSANFVVAIGQYFIRAKAFLCRHHINEAALYGFHRSWSYRVTNKLAKRVIVVSEASREYMIKRESMNASKLIHINLAYNFWLYGTPELSKVNAIRDNHQKELLLVTACRLTKFKRPNLSIAVLKKLRDANVKAHLIILGTGEIMDELKNYAKDLAVVDHVTFEGHVMNVLEYLGAADFIIHPSVLESSSVVIKEAGIVNKPVIVCKGVGDFDDFITNERNGFLVEENQFVDQAYEVIINNHKNNALLCSMGVKLCESVFALFNIDKIGAQYKQLLD
jgi:glycosyltransferase involved in cell wall biosynthesis